MRRWSLQEVLDEFNENIQRFHSVNIEAIIVDADPSKGFKYPYILAYPQSNMRNTLVLDCLNDYEDPMPAGVVDNQVALDEIFNLFGKGRIASSVPNSTNAQTEEEYAASKQRIAERVGSGMNHISMLLRKVGFLESRMPIIIPLIPGHTNDTHENCASELSKNFAEDVDLQVIKMIEDARQIILNRTNVALDSQVECYGYSKSSLFVNNFTTLHPEMVKGLVAGGDGLSTPLPIEELRLRVREKVKENEEFEIINGIAYKNVTRDELDRIINEYNASKEEYQRKIAECEDGSYSLPINYPLGVADIEKYRDLSSFPGGKDGYKKALAEIPRMAFVGEREDEAEGGFSYGGGVTADGRAYSYAEDFEEESELYEVERAGMHNRVLEYKQARLILFGRGANEAIRNYIDLATKLGLNVQFKIYEKVSHFGMFSSIYVAEDVTQSLVGISEGNGIPQLSDKGRAHRISPIFQLLRRAKVCPSGDKAAYEAISSKLPSLPEEPDETAEENYYEQLESMMRDIDSYLVSSGRVTPDTNIDRAYDSLTTAEIREIFLKEKTNEENHFPRAQIDKIAKEEQVAMESENSDIIMKKIEEPPLEQPKEKPDNTIE